SAASCCDGVGFAGRRISALANVASDTAARMQSALNMIKMSPRMQPIVPIEQFSIFASGLDHPECCAFDSRGFCWAGGEAGQVYRIDPAGKVQTVCSLGSFNGGVAFSPDDELFVCNPAQGVV